VKGLKFLIPAFIFTGIIFCNNNDNNDPGRLKKVKTYDSESITINQMKCHISNSFPGFDFSQYEGLYWPGGINAGRGIIFMDQLFYSCIVNDSVISTRIFSPEFFPGKIQDTGVPVDPGNPNNRIYVLQKGWETMVPGPVRDRLESDYNEWPVDEGAPWEDRDGDGIFTRGIDVPRYLGDKTIWYVMNDKGPDSGAYNYRSTPTLLGLEIQITLYGFDRTDDLGDVVFRDYKIINKSGSVINDFYLGYFGDLEIGWASDDRSGTDTTLDMVYAYNSTDFDPIFGEGPPAAGTMLLRGPIIPASPSDSAFRNGRWIRGYKNNRLQSSYLSLNGRMTDTTYAFSDPDSAIHVSNMLHGLMSNGMPMFDPNTSSITKFCLAGDPIERTGWYFDESGWPGLDTVASPEGDVRMTAGFGHFNLAPYDTQEIILATIGAQDSSNMSSISQLKRKAKIVKFLFGHNFRNVPPIQAPEVHAYPQESKVTLWWENNCESYEQVNPALAGQGYPDTAYRFQGYIVRQYKDEQKTDPRIVKVFDIPDSLLTISGYIIVNGEKVKVPLIGGSNEGLQQFIDITTDLCTGEPLRNANPYYFSVDAYAVNVFSNPTFVESDGPVIKVLPGREKIDFSSPYSEGSEVAADQVGGLPADAKVIFRVIDPQKITGDEYKVSFYGSFDSLKYSLTDNTTGDTLLKDISNISPDTLHNKIFDGVMLVVNDAGRNTIDTLPYPARPFGLKKITETRGPGGIPLDNPIDVFNKMNSTGKWQITSIGGSIQNVDVYNHIYTYDYELRFTGNGSEYYTFGNPINDLIFVQNQKAADRIPFEIWNTTLNKRLYVKIRDIGVKDHLWSKDTVRNQWEQVFAYNPGTVYSEPIPAVSDSSDSSDYSFGNFIIKGDLPEEGTVIKIETLKPLVDGDQYTASPQKADFNNIESAKDKINKISVFPNPYFGGSDLERSMGERIIRFTGLPKEVTIRIYTLAGVFVRRLDKSDLSQYIDWDLKNESGSLVASGVYIAHLDMPGIGTKILKLAVVIGKEFLNRE
jgi:hypothetical protein